LRFGFTGSGAEESISHRLRSYAKDSVRASGYFRPHWLASKLNKSIAMHPLRSFGLMAIAAFYDDLR